MMKPTLHLNGTSKGKLERQVCDAYDAIQTAMKTLAEAAPNGRDYYPQGSDAIYRAQDEHCARMQKLVDVSKELEQIAEHLAFAQGGRP